MLREVGCKFCVTKDVLCVRIDYLLVLAFLDGATYIRTSVSICFLVFLKTAVILSKFDSKLYCFDKGSNLLPLQNLYLVALQNDALEWLSLNDHQ